jgi:hypothetical protein
VPLLGNTNPSGDAKKHQQAFLVPLLEKALVKRIYQDMFCNNPKIHTPRIPNTKKIPQNFHVLMSDMCENQAQELHLGVTQLFHEHNLNLCHLCLK